MRIGIRFISALLLFTRLSSQASVFDSAEVSSTCPGSVTAWSAARDALWKSNSLVEVLAFGELVHKCRTGGLRKADFKNRNLVRCLKPLEDLAALLVEGEVRKSPLLELNSRKLPENVRHLPKAFQDKSFWESFASQDQHRSRAAVSDLESKIKGSKTFRYRSELQPRSDLFLTIFLDGGVTRFIHFDKERNVNLLSMSGASREEVSLSTISVAERGVLARGDAAGGRCFRCHQTEVLAITPVEGAESEWFVRNPPSVDPVRWFNKTYAKGGATGYSELFKNLPVVGSHVRENMEAFVQECFHARSREKVTQYKEAMKCVLCHNDHEMPALRFPFGNAADLSVENNHRIVTLERTVHQDLGMSDKFYGSFVVPQLFIENGHMPLDFKEVLTGEERRTLFRCLMTDYLGGLYPDVEPTLKKTKGLLMQSLLKESCFSGKAD